MPRNAPASAALLNPRLSLVGMGCVAALPGLSRENKAPGAEQSRSLFLGWLGGLGAGPCCPNSSWGDPGIIQQPGQLQRQQLLWQHPAGVTGPGIVGLLWDISEGTAGGVEMGQLQGTPYLGTHEEDEDALASLWNTTERTRRAQLHPEQHPSPWDHIYLAPDPTAPTAPQSLQGPSGPSAVTEMQIRGCDFKNIINKDLQCPEEHLQAGR